MVISLGILFLNLLHLGWVCNHGIGEGWEYLVVYHMASRGTMLLWGCWKG